MASTSYGPTQQADSVRGAIAEVKSLIVDRLKKVLRNENLQVSGIKSELQLRLIAHIERCAASGDYARIERIRQALRGGTGFANNPYPSPYSTHTPTASLSPQFNSPTPRQLPAQMPPFSMSPYAQSNRLTFKPSPFYTIIKSVSMVHELKAREQTRDNKKIELQLSPAVLEQLQKDRNIRIMVFCAAESTGKLSEPLDISFPQHGELKCNSDDVKHNLKGMKNKPGTTRPADITSYIRKSVTYPNSIEFIYALTVKVPVFPQKYFLVVNMVQKKPLETLVAELKQRRTPFQKERVLAEMRSKADDPDIVATSIVMSLKDPLQMTRIQTPCRGLSCNHNSCFDAAAFLALQEQAPTWSCPYCNKAALWDNLAFDHYFDDILRNTPSSIDQVTIEPDGQWSRDSGTPAHGNPSNGGGTSDDDDDDDIVEITDSKISGSRSSFKEPSFMRTPSLPTLNSTSFSTAQSSAQSPVPPRSNKRSHAETIDLTLDSDDDDDDEPPMSRVKRPSLSNSTTSDLYRTQSTHSEPIRFTMPPPPPNPYSMNRNPYY